MLMRKCLGFRQRLLRKYLLNNAAPSNSFYSTQIYSVLSSKYKYLQCTQTRQEFFAYHSHNSSLLFHRKWYCKGLIEDANDISKKKELLNVSELFPEARVTLNILSQRTPDKIFDVHFIQHKAGKKAVKNHEWTCFYKFSWPEKIKFESTAISKRVAAEKAAQQALHWLYTNGRINTKGQPVYDAKVIEEIKSNLEEPIHAEVSENSMERIERIWTDYECGIKPIYEKAAENARLKAIEAPEKLTKDSTIDDDADYVEENEASNELPLLSDTKSKGPIDPVYGRVLTPRSIQALKRRAEALDRSFEHYEQNITALPIDQYVEQITTTLENNRVCVIVGAAGCGKSSRVPAALLRHCRLDGKIVVSEPRRVAAIGLAERVASEMGEEVGESIGYQVRLQSKPPRPPAGSVLYCTSGVLLNRLHSNPDLSGCTHVIIDEAHERDVNTDVTMLLLKRAMKRNTELKLLIMSATLNTDVFSEYFDSCPVIEVPGTTYPVEISYLDDIQKKYNIKLPNIAASCKKEGGKPQLNIAEITEVIKAVDKREKEGGVLVFLPGWAEIKYVKQMLDECYKDSTLHLVLPVHSRLSTADQSRMFSTPSPGIRKIVLATNIAETSVTIPDIIHVIDAGAHRENTLTRGSGTSSLETVWVSSAGSKQRCGRAGRVQPGYCYRLYTKEKEDEFLAHTTPEILRTPLEQTVLDCKTYAPEDKAVDFLSELPQPPSLQAVQYAVQDLIDIGALTPSEQMTRLGWLLSSLSLAPRIALTLIRSATVCAVLPQANIAAIHDVEVFHNSSDRREEIREIKRRFHPTSDHAALHWLLSEFENELRATNWQTVDTWCDKHGLKKERLGYTKSLSSIYLRELLKTGLIERNLELEDINRFSDIEELSVATMFSAVDALFVTKRHVKTKGKLKTVNDVFSTTGERAHIASESVNSNLNKTVSKATLIASYRGRHSVERRALMLYKTSIITPQAALLFTMGPVEQLQAESDGNTAVLCMTRHKLNICVPASQSATLMKAREMLWSTFNYQIDRDVKDLEYEEVTTLARFKIRLLKAICKILIEATDRDVNQRKTNNVNEEFG